MTWPGRHWRISVTAVDGSTDYVSFGELELLEGATDRTTGRGGSATQSGNGAVGSASSGIDDSTETECGSSLALPYTWSVDLGAVYLIDQLTLTAQRVVPNRTPKTLDIQVSEDGLGSWTTIMSVTDQTGWAQYEKRTFTLPNAHSVSGTVTDSTGAPVARTVRAYRRDTGALTASTTSNATTGEYTLIIPAVEHNVVVLDDDAGDLLNDLIMRVIPE